MKEYQPVANFELRHDPNTITETNRLGYDWRVIDDYDRSVVLKSGLSSATDCKRWIAENGYKLAPLFSSD